VAAIIGRTVSFPLLAAALGRSEHETLGALDAALYERLLVEEAPRGVSEGSRTGTTYRFTHDLIHEAILHDLSAARRMTLHRAVGEALERAPEERRQRYVSDLAHHFVEAHEPEPGLRYTLLSGRHAESVYAYAEAEQRYLTALALARELGDQEAEGVALERLSAAMRHGQRAEALALILEQALERHVSPDALERRRWIVAQLGQTYAETGAVDTGKERLISLLPSLETGAPSANLAAVYVALAYLYRSAEQHAEQLDVARKGAALARATHDDPTLTDALFWEGTALFRLGHAEQATEALEVALRLSKASGDPWMLSLALNKAAMPYSALGDFSRAREYTQQALEIAESAGIHGLVYNRLGELAGLAYTIGDWHLALTYMERKDRLHQDQMASHVVGWIYPNHLAFRGELRLATGRVDLAEADLREAIARSVHNRNADLSARCVLAQRDLLAGQPEAARAWVAGYLTRDDASPLDPHIDANTLDLQWVLVWTLTETGETRRAQMLADQALDKATGWRYPVTQVDALWACAFVALRMADWDTASSRLDEALALCRVLPYPHAEARCLYLYGQLHASQCDARRACECLDAALTICLRLGERFYSTVIERELQSQRELLAQGGRVRLRF
jgi:tetratricopeptide (TPR) repeat protein